MDTAHIRIKFSPLIQKVNSDDSKCCLEIVPEVSCLKNFDKIEWKHNCDFYEYVIPMNYKIILKKREREKVVDDNLDQTYHSCVDLLRTSITNCSMGSGDVNRIVSDNFMLGRISTQETISNIFQTPRNEIYCINDKTQETQSSKISQEADHVVHTESPNAKAQIEECASPLKQSSSSMYENNSCQSKFLDKVIDAVKKLVEKSTYTSPDTSTLRISENNTSIETIDRVVPVSTRIVAKLSVSPICSVNTKDSTLTIPVFENSTNSIFSREYVWSPKTSENVCSFIATNKIINNMKYEDYPPVRRQTPSERVDQFLKLMEKEILPLKSMLNEIVTKYTSLKINQTLFKNIHLEKLPCWEKETKRMEYQNELKSNRVVYTVVYDD